MEVLTWNSPPCGTPVLSKRCPKTPVPDPSWPKLVHPDVANDFIVPIDPGLHALLDDVAETLADYPLLPAARADLLRRLGRRAEAATAYRQALALVTNEAERRFLEQRLMEVTHPAR